MTLNSVYTKIRTPSGLGCGAARLIKKGCQAGLGCDIAKAKQLGGLHAAAPDAAEHRSTLNPLLAQPVTIADCLPLALVVQKPLPFTPIQGIVGRVSDAGGVGMAHPEDVVR